MDKAQMEKLLKELGEAAASAKWVEEDMTKTTGPLPDGARALAFGGDGGGYKFTLVRWVTTRGEGVDCMVVHAAKGLVIRVTPDLAWGFFLLAVKQNPPTKCSMVSNPGESTDIECGRRVKVGWTICEDCYKEMEAYGDFTREELSKMYELGRAS